MIKQSIILFVLALPALFIGLSFLTYGFTGEQILWLPNTDIAIRKTIVALVYVFSFLGSIVISVVYLLYCLSRES